MRKILYFILSLAGLAYIVFSAVYLLNLSYGFITDVNLLSMMSKLMLYAPVAILGGFCFVNFFGKTFKLLFFILLILAVVFFILVVSNPSMFGFMFGK